MVALTDIFKKNKKEEKPKKEVQESKEVKIEKPKVKKELKIGQSYRILKAPHVTEKAGDLAGKDQYIFRIFPRANKIETRKAIEDTYGVDVVSVKIINIPDKKIRLGKNKGIRAGYKKAIIRIKKGQKIEVLPR